MKLTDATKKRRTTGKNYDPKKLSRNLASNNRYVQHVEKALLAHPDAAWSFDHAPKLKDDAWHPSGDCTPPLQELYDKATAHPDHQEPPAKASLLKAWMVGQFWHRWLQHVTVEHLGFATWDAVERKGTTVWAWGQPEHEGIHDGQYAQPWRWATGSGDVAPVDLPRHGKQLLDYKTMNAKDFKLIPPPPQWAAKWECQLNVYMDWFDLGDAVLVGICKDAPHGLKEFHYERNQPLIDAIYEKWHVVSDCLDDGKRPPAPDDDDAFEVELPLKGTVT